MQLKQKKCRGDVTGVPSKHVVVLEDCGPVDIFVEVGLLTFVTFVTW